MKDFWNQRYASGAYAFGAEPNVFFKTQIDKLKSGKILMPADGEGRNGVYAATKNWEVVCCDESEEGKRKANQLAASKNVTIDYRIADFGELLLEADYFDCVGLVYAHFPLEKRALFHQKAIRALKPGGTIILEGFSKNQLGNPSGGPKSLDMLFSEEELKSDFRELSMLNIREEETTLDEGPFHQGKAAVIRLVGKK